MTLAKTDALTLKPLQSANPCLTALFRAANERFPKRQASSKRFEPPNVSHVLLVHLDRVAGSQISMRA